jgi:hypothetical protein
MRVRGYRHPMIAPEPSTALLRPVPGHPDETVMLQPGRPDPKALHVVADPVPAAATGGELDDFGDVRAVPTRLVGDRDPMDAWYALVGRPGGAGAVPA